MSLNRREVFALVTGVLLMVPVHWLRDPIRMTVRLVQPSDVLQHEAAALRSEVDALTARVHDRVASIVRRSLREDYGSYGTSREVRTRVKEEIDAVKAAAPVPAAVTGFTFARGGGHEIRVAGAAFGDDEMRQALGDGAELLRVEIARLHALALDALVQAAAAAMRDDFLSIQEEESVVAAATRTGAALRSRAAYPAAAGGLTLSLEPGHQIIVHGFSFDAAESRQALDLEVTKRVHAVRERDLVDRLVGHLRRLTEDDRMLDDDERAMAVKLSTTPDPGKRAALSAATVNRVITKYCQEHGIRTGPRGSTDRSAQESV